MRAARLGRVLKLAALAGLLGITACAVDVEAPLATRNPDEGPNAGMFRDFVDGKLDTAGHPLNAIVVDVDRRDCTRCMIELPANARGWGLTANVHLRVTEAPSSGRVVTLRALDASDAEVNRIDVTVETLRDDRWIDLPLALSGAVRIAVEVGADARIDLAYAEVFPSRFGLVTGPGSGVFGARDTLTIELPKDDTLDTLTADGVSVKATLEALIEEGGATRTTTALRTLYDVRVDDLLPARGEVTDLRVGADGDAARVTLRQAPVTCEFEGDPAGTRVLVTGFQTFPADGRHENVSGVAVTALDGSAVRGAKVMKLVLPVEYDRAAAIVTDVIERCRPTHVLSFGQGGQAIALEETAYNLQDTGELAGGVPDNRGIIRSATPIDRAGPAERATTLPLDEIRDALADLGEDAQRSTDPGRYICNNVMYNNLARVTGRTGFIHLPYTTQYPDRARWGRIVEAAVQATVDAR